MKLNIRSRSALAVTLVLVLTLSLALSGCGSLSRILGEPDPPRESTPVEELTNLMRTGEEYRGIEIFHGTWEEPCYTEDKTGYFYEEQGWIYLHIEGEPSQRGFQHGWLLADYVQRNVDFNAVMFADLYTVDWNYLRENVGRMWADKVDEEFKAELEGIVRGAAQRGASFDYLDLLVLNGLEELRDCWFPTVQETYYQELANGLWDPESIVSSAALIDEEAIADEEAREDTNDAADANNAADATDIANAASATGTESEESQDSGFDSPGSDSASSKSEENTEGVDEGAQSATEDTSETAEDTADSSESLRLHSVQDGLTGSLPSGLTDTPVLGGNVSVFGEKYIRQASVILATGSATEDGDIILAHNSIAAYTDSNFSNVMIDVDPSQGTRFTMQAAPGLVHSVAEAYSSESLLIANTLIKGFNVYNEEGTPEFLRIRRAVQNAETLDEFSTIMREGTNGGLASSWLVGEIETGQIMEMELGLSFYSIEKLDNGWFLSFNGADDTRIMSYETDGSGYTDIRGSAGSRYLQLRELSKYYNGKLTTDSAKAIISDHYDSYLNKALASSRSICAHFDTDDAKYALETSVEPYMPYGTVDAIVMSTELSQNNTVLARWGSACGRSFDSTSFLEKRTQYTQLQSYLYDRPSYTWDKLYPIDEKE